MSLKFDSNALRFCFKFLNYVDIYLKYFDQKSAFGLWRAFTLV